MNNLTLYKLTKKETLEGLTEAVLEDNKFKTCDTYTTRSIGFSRNKDEMYLSSFSEGTLITVTEQLKKVDANALKTKTKERVEKLSFSEDRKLSKKEIDTISMEVTEELLPQTFPKAEKNFRVFFRKDGLVFVEGSSKRADDIFSFIRKVLGSFPIVPVETEETVNSYLEALILTKKEDSFELLEKAKLTTLNEGVVSLSKISLEETALADLVKESAYIESIELLWDGVLRFNIKEDFSFSGIKYENTLSKSSIEADLAESQEESTIEFIQITELSKVVDVFLEKLTLVE